MKCIYGNSLSPLGAESKEIPSASQTLLMWGYSNNHKYVTGNVIPRYHIARYAILVMRYTMNDFPAIGYSCFAHRILGSLGGKHCESLQRIVWHGVVSPLKAVSLGIECHTLP